MARPTPQGCTPGTKLTGIQFDDQRFVDVGGELVAVGRLLEHAFSLVDGHVDPGRETDLLGQFQRFDHAGLLLRLLAHGDDITGLHRVRRDVDRLAVDGDRLVRHDLARFSTGRGKAHAEDHVVETCFEQEQQVGAGVATAAIGFREVAAELALQHTVSALDLLLLAQLQAEIGGALTRGATVLAGLGVELGLVADGAAGALEQQVRAFTAGKFGLGAEVTCHVGFLELSATTCIAKMPLRSHSLHGIAVGLAKNATAETAVALRKAFEYTALSGTASDTTTLLRAAAVVRHGRHVGDRVDADAEGTQSTNRRFATRTWALDLDVQVLDALLDGSTTSHLGSHLGGKGRRLARAFETLTTRRSPGQSIALTIGDGDDGVVERSVHVGNAVGNVLADFLANACGCGAVG